jgi:hypothetical protein
MSEQGETVEPTPVAPTGLKKKAMEVGLKLYLKLPPPAQQKTITVMMKVVPPVQRVAPHAKKIIAGTVAVAVVRTVRRRG